MIMVFFLVGAAVCFALQDRPSELAQSTSLHPNPVHPTRLHPPRHPPPPPQVVTLTLDFLLHRLRAFLRRRRKAGLLTAVNHLSGELMLLGVASLLLTAIEPRLEHICLKTGDAMRPWLFRVEGCACCLARTEGVSECFLQVGFGAGWRAGVG
jgi:hypothetical protein